MNSIKSKLFTACEDYLKSRISRLSAELKSLEIDLENESKSSAGDKYETGREMINMEWNKISNQLQQFKVQKDLLEKAKNRINREVSGLGSLVKTNAANYFIAIPAGKIIIEEGEYFAIGPGSPIAQLFQQKKAGEEIVFNGKSTKILEVV